MKKIIQLTVSLTAISAVCAAVLATVNSVTSGQIATIKVRARENAARLVMPRSVEKVEASGDSAAGFFTGRDASGQAIAYALDGVSKNGYGGNVRLMVGFLPDRTIVSYRKLEAAETPGLGSNLTSEDFMKQFRGMPAAKDISVAKDGGEVVAITSATITSRAVCEAINDARGKLDAALAK